MNSVEKEQAKEVKRLAKIYKEDYITLERELQKLFRQYEQDGVINYAQLIYDGADIRMDYIVSLTTINRYKEVLKGTERVLQTSAIDTVERMRSIKEIPAISQTFRTDHIINNQMAGLHWVERVGKNRSDVIQSLQGSIKEGLEAGKTYKTMTDELAKELGTDLYKAERIIRTESMRVMDETKLEVFREVGREVTVMKKWMSVGDERVREAHTQMDGVTVGLEEDFVSPAGGRGKMPRLMDNPADSINCRCNVSMVIV